MHKQLRALHHKIHTTSTQVYNYYSCRVHPPRAPPPRPRDTAPPPARFALLLY